MKVIKRRPIKYMSIGFRYAKGCEEIDLVSGIVRG